MNWFRGRRLIIGLQSPDFFGAKKNIAEKPGSTRP
jgi:hypothetical protein